MRCFSARVLRGLGLEAGLDGAHVHGHGATVDPAQLPALLELVQVPADGGGGDAQLLAQLLDADRVADGDDLAQALLALGREGRDVPGGSLRIAHEVV